MELVQLTVDKEYMMKEADGSSFKFKPKSSVNKDSYVFIPSMLDKRICLWVAIDKLIEFNKLSLEILTASTSLSSSIFCS
jgi:hypothetical protein